MPFIPDPGSPPGVPPVQSGTEIGPEYLVDADTVVYQTGDTRVFNGFNSTVTNHGTVWLDNGLAQAWFVAGGQSGIINSGLIYVHGTSQAALAPQLGSLTNTGSIYVISDGGWARGVSAAAYPVTVDNSGLIAVQSLGVDPQSEHLWNATAIDADGTAVIVNREGGQILAEAPRFAVGIFSSGSDGSQDAPPGRKAATH